MHCSRTDSNISHDGLRFADFLRVGTVLTVLFALASAWMALRLWPGAG
jgi:hypothetical protein